MEFVSSISFVIALVTATADEVSSPYKGVIVGLFGTLFVLTLIESISRKIERQEQNR